MEIRALPAEDVRPLRRAVLRPHQPPEQAQFAGDTAPGTLHAGAFDEDGRLLGVGSVAPEPHPRDPAPGDWRLRGMATDPGARGRGVGAAVLEACVAHVGAHGGRRLWCNARTPARGFYERMGFAVEGGEFEIAGIGPHVLMSRVVVG